MGAGCWHTCVIKQGMYVIAPHQWWPEWSCPPTKVTKPWQLHTIQERPATLLANIGTVTYHQMTQVSVTSHSPANENRSTVSTWILAVCPSTSITVLPSSPTSATSQSLQSPTALVSNIFGTTVIKRKKMFAGHIINSTDISYSFTINYNTVSSVPTLRQWNVSEINL